MFATFAIAAAFSTYFCVYAYRRPFAAGTFEGAVQLPFGLATLDYKVLLIVAQVGGYCISKFAGIKFVSELLPAGRGRVILALIGTAEAALLLFAITPAPYNAVWMVLNGLPLGIVWGLVFGFLEGRRLSEVLGAGLSASFIVASGFVKTVAVWLMQAGVPELWMPFATGLVFALPLVIAVGMLSLLPPPTAADEALRTRREPMGAAARWRFFAQYAPGLVLLTVLYIFLAAFRDFRDNFAREIWSALGYDATPSIMASSEVPVAIGVLVVLASVMVLKNNRLALTVVHAIMLASTIMIGVATFAFQAGWLGAAPWMILVGLGLYVAYVPYGCVLFDRLIATVRFVGTSGFMIYVADSFGYLGSAVLLLYKNFGQPNLSWLEFFTGFAYTTSVVCSVSLVFSMIYFHRAAGRAVAASQGATATEAAAA